jgi:hypothetical protein
MHWLGRFLASYAKTGNGRVPLRLGCLFFAPFITLFVWMVQAIIWAIVAVPVLAFGLLMAAIGGGFSRGVASEWQTGYQHIFGEQDPTFEEPHTAI